MRRLALIIGCSDYVDLDPLPNAAGDANSIAAALQDRGFETRLCTELDGISLSQEIDDFCATADKVSALSVIYFAGHGCEQHGLTYVYPIDMPSGSAALIPQYAIPLKSFVSSNKQDGARVVILDCCRLGESNLRIEERARFEEFASDVGHRNFKAPPNTLIAYSTSSGESASDGSGDHGPYCEEIVPLLLTHRLTVEDVFKEVGMKVSSRNGTRQRPWFYSNLASDLTFSDMPDVVPMMTVASSTRSNVRGLVKKPNESRVLVYSDQSRDASLLDEVATDGNYQFATPPKLISCWDGGLVVLDEAKLWIQESGGDYRGIKVDAGDAHCLCASSNGRRFIVGGTNEFHIVDIDGRWTKTIQTPKTCWYSTIFIDDARALIAGSTGSLREVVFLDEDLQVNAIDLGLRAHLYVLCMSDPSHVVIGCGGGRVIKVNMVAKYKTSWVKDLGRTVRSPAARMQSILDVATDNEIIRRFLFYPESVPSDDLSKLTGNLRSQNILYCATVGWAPMVVLGCEDGMLYILDSRDGRLVEKIDAAPGNLSDMYGMCFLDKERFAVLLRSGDVRFYSLTTVPYDKALSFVDASEVIAWAPEEWLSTTSPRESEA